MLAQILLAPLAGLIVVTAGFSMAFGLNAASFVVSAFLLRRLPSPRPADAGPTGRRIGVVREGAQALRLIGQNELLRAMAVAQALAALSAGGTSALLVVLAQRRLHAGGTGYGTMLAGIAVGALAGPALLSRLGDRARRPGTLFAAFGLRGIVDLVLAGTVRLPVAIGALAAYGIGTSTGNITFSTLLQTHVADRIRGRTFAVFDLIWQACGWSACSRAGPSPMPLGPGAST